MDPSQPGRRPPKRKPEIDATAPNAKQKSKPSVLALAMVAHAENARSNPMYAANQDNYIDEVQMDTRHALQMCEMIYDRGASQATDARTVQKSSLPFVVIAAQFLLTTMFLFVLVLNHCHLTISANYRTEFVEFVASPIELSIPAFMFPYAQALVGVYKNTRAHNYKQIAVPSHCALLRMDDGAIADSFGSLAHLGRHRDTYPYCSMAVFFAVIQSFCTVQVPQPKYQSFFRNISVDWRGVAFVAAAAVVAHVLVNPAPALVAAGGVAINAAFTAAGTSLSQEMYIYAFCLGIGGFGWSQVDLRRRARNLCSGMLQFLPDYSVAPTSIFASFTGVKTIDALTGIYKELTKVCKISGIDMVPIGLEDISDKPVAFTVCVKYISNTAATDIHVRVAGINAAQMQTIRISQIGELQDYEYGIFAQLKEGDDADGIKFITQRQADIESIFSCMTAYNAALVYIDENACYYPNVIAGNDHYAANAHRAGNLALAAANSRRFPSPGGHVQFRARFVTRSLREEISRKVATDLMEKRSTDHNIEIDF